MTGSDRPHLVLHSERTEEDGGGVQAPDGFDERFGAVRMVTVDQHSTRARLPDRIVDAFRSVDKLRLIPVELHHQTQQRCDYLFARKNQNVTHSGRPRRVVNTRQLADLRVLWRIAGNP
jgi:hypothetical protein